LKLNYIPARIFVDLIKIKENCDIISISYNTMAPSVAGIPEAAPITVRVKSLPEKTDATIEAKAEPTTEAKDEANPKIRRVIDEEGGNTTATVRFL
jgi:hypothetical protein